MQRMQQILFGVALSLVYSLAAAASYQSGDWTYEADGNDAQAYTMSNTGVGFGEHCVRSTTKCYYYLRTNNTCTAGQFVPILVSNTQTGGAAISGICFPLNTPSGTVYDLELSPYATMQSAVQSGKLIGFALPMADGEFYVFRFSLNGAVSAMRKIADYVSHSAGDQTL